MKTRRAGQHARATTRRIARRALAAVALLTVAGIAGTLFFGFRSWASIGLLAAVVVALKLIDRVEGSRVERWDRGADGEERVGEIIDALAGDGWHGIHDVDLGRGNIDHVLVGPAGVLTVETKSHGGRLAVDRIDEAMLRQAYAQAKAVERVTDGPVAPLLLFSRAFLDRPCSRRRGVTILPARLLRGHLARRPRVLAADEVARLHARLLAALT